MHRAIDPSQIVRPIIQTAPETTCRTCQRTLAICQHRDRHVWCLDGLIHLRYRDKRCPDLACENHAVLYRPHIDLRLALPRMSFGLDVILAVGQRHLEREQSLSQIGRELTQSGVPIHQTHVGDLFRHFLVLCRLARGDEATVQQKLRDQGGIYLMIDGVQFDEKSPVLYLCWDARSGTPLFGERLAKRDADAVGAMVRRVKKMGVPVRGVTTDGEHGLVSAIRQVFPEVPHQLCQTHFLFNCAKPMEVDLKALQTSVEERAEQVRQLQKGLERKPAAADVPKPTIHPADAAIPEPAAQLSGATVSERELVQRLCEAARLQARASGKAPLNPRSLARHQRLEQIHQMVKQARKKKTKAGNRSPRPGWTGSMQR